MAASKKTTGKKATTGAAAQGFEPTEDQRLLVSCLAIVPIQPKNICRFIINPKTEKPVGLETLYNHFAEELSDGGAATASLCMSALTRNMRAGGQPANTAAIFVLKTRFGFRERIELENIDGLDSMNDADAARVAQAVLDSNQQNEQARESLRTATIDDEPAGTA